ncbi:MAG: NAD(P)H-hydrate dehydratase [Sediminibacterium sp.]|nr:NAD(P)H-hydrate dehydratase [Sediminibacterium sp.]MDP3128678.1 NAD(P)H-hydrate dehydratase [Sediminibacterium sp.]
MKLLSAQQIREWDQYTIANKPIPSINLMEKAALACMTWMNDKGIERCISKIFCGKGNNGGDGLAIARLLIQKGHSPTIYILESENKGTVDFEANLQFLTEYTDDIHFIKSVDDFPFIEDTEWVIDALFGSGLNRPLQAVSAELVQHINQSGSKIISIDIPGGMGIDFSCKNKSVIRANHTVTFQNLKRCFLIAENADFFGKISVLDIEPDNRFLETVETLFTCISGPLVHSMLQPRKPFSHKGNHGHALLLAGNKGKMGAAVIAAKACLRSGAGMLTVNVPFAFSSIIHGSIPEAILIAREENIQFLNVYKSIGIGPGFGMDGDSERILALILSGFSAPMVIDADAITILSLHKDWLTSVPRGSILSPHPKEFDRLFGSCENDYERADKAMALSKKYPFIIILKGHHSLIAADGRGWYNLTGNAGLAKGGSGDVLTGMLTALLAQQYSPLHAALIGVYLHGLAADIAIEEQSMESLLATDIIEMIGKAFRKVLHDTVDSIAV